MNAEKQKARIAAGFFNMAEEQRFELWDGFPSTVFKTVALSHSAIPPEIFLSLHSARVMAEEERFELSDGFPSTVFKTVALSHSATPPQ
jgi:hypothetical protein